MSTLALQPVKLSSTTHILRPAREEDAEFLFSIFTERNRERFAQLGWSDAHLRSMLRMQYQARVAGYASQYGNLQRLVICTEDSRPMGEISLHRVVRETRIVDICVVHEYQNRGIGSQILWDLQRQAAANGSVITLSVDHENPAKRLYLRQGFRETGCNALQAEMRWCFVDADMNQIDES